jgi:hypothetical protein
VVEMRYDLWFKDRSGTPYLLRGTKYIHDAPGADLNETRSSPNDGWVAQSSMEFGRDGLRMDRVYDHPGMGEDPHVIDEIARRLAGIA